jgi:hypothetical protein
MGTRRFDRLSDVARIGGLVAARCRGCGREALFDPAALSRALDADRALAALRFRCASADGGCGGTDVAVALRPGPETRARMDRPRPIRLAGPPEDASGGAAAAGTGPVPARPGPRRGGSG